MHADRILRENKLSISAGTISLPRNYHSSRSLSVSNHFPPSINLPLMFGEKERWREKAINCPRQIKKSALISHLGSSNNQQRRRRRRKNSVGLMGSRSVVSAYKRETKSCPQSTKLCATHAWESVRKKRKVLWALHSIISNVGHCASRERQY